jgi:SAM-dependent methyltransferase
VDGTPQEQASNRRIDTSRPHPARRYNYWLGGKDHFQADRDSAAMIEQIMPSVSLAAKEGRKFHGRAVRYLAEAGVRQFLDIGTGLPAPNNTHEVAQSVDPTARVVYVDNDPLVLAHARALLHGGPQGRTAYLEADLRHPHTILHSPHVYSTLDLQQPVALLLVAVMHFILDDDRPYDVVGQLLDVLPSGSYLVVSHATTDFMPPEQLAILEAANARVERREDRVRLRSQAEVERFFDGLELVPPGVCSLADWRPTDPQAPRPTPAEICALGGVARIP